MVVIWDVKEGWVTSDSPWTVQRHRSERSSRVRQGFSTCASDRCDNAIGTDSTYHRSSAVYKISNSVAIDWRMSQARYPPNFLEFLYQRILSLYIDHTQVQRRGPEQSKHRRTFCLKILSSKTTQNMEQAGVTRKETWIQLDSPLFSIIFEKKVREESWCYSNYFAWLSLVVISVS